MNKMKVIFLDIDGVLNSTDYSIVNHRMAQKTHSHHQAIDKHGDYFDPRCVRWLEYIVFQTNADLVISSTWRNRGIDKLKDLWYDRKLPGYISGVTDRGEKIRGDQIKRWLDDPKDIIGQKAEVTSYVILDDDSDMLPEQKNNFVKCNHEFGITEKEAMQVIKILNNNEDKND